MARPQDPSNPNSGEAYDGLFNGGASAGDQATAPRDPAAPPGSWANPVVPRSRAEARALPSGFHFVDTFGAVRVRH